MKDKINVFLFAAHHTRNNIASRRFKGLLKYLDPKRFRVYVITRECPGLATDKAPSHVHVISLPGNCVGKEASLAASLLSIASAFLRPLPFIAARTGALKGGGWLVKALVASDRLCRERLAAGERCVVMGTGSPIDALIAAASLARRHGLPCIQDFRDGLVFEPLGRKGVLAGITRSLVERRVVSVATLITSVSRPIVDDFIRRYPTKRVDLLPNGYDPDDFVSQNHADVEEADLLMARCVPQGSILIGHFGRVGASDASSSQTLDRFVSLMNAFASGYIGWHVVFVGELTAREKQSLSRAKFSVSTIKSVRHGLALELMRRCDRLLLLTGNRISCATGKIFEYLATGVPVICVTGVMNAAASILSETGAGETLVAHDDVEDVEKLRRILDAPSSGVRDVSAYSKATQADVFSHWIDEMVKRE